MDIRTEKEAWDAIREDSVLFKYVPDGLKTENMCFEAVKRVPANIDLVPRGMRTAELCEEAVKGSPFVLGHVPEKLRTRDMCLSAVQRGGIVLGDVPESLKDREMCLAAVRDCPDAMRFVPEGQMDEALCLEAVQGNADGKAKASLHEPLGLVPESFRTPAVCTAAVKASGRALRYVPEWLKTPEICLEAVKQDGMALEFVPKKQRTKELCMEAVKSDPTVLADVPNAVKTEEMCLAAMEHADSKFVFASTLLRRFVPPRLKTDAVMLAAVTADPISLESLPDRLKTDEVCLEAVRKSEGRALQYCPPDFLARAAETLTGEMKPRQEESFANGFFDGFCKAAPEWYKGDALENDCDSRTPFATPWHWMDMEEWFDSSLSPKEMGSAWAESCAQRMEEERERLKEPAEDEGPRP